jgi:hypothetical protein
MTGTALRLRPRTAVIASVCVFAILLSIAWLRRPHQAPTFDADGALSVVSLESGEGQELTKRFNLLSPQPLPMQTGTAAFLDVAWTATPPPDPNCQAQLAVHVPSMWRTYDWASDHRIANGTINSWGTILARHPELRDNSTTITITPTTSGRALVVWLTPTGATSDAELLRVRIAYACGDADRSAPIFSVPVTAS